VRTHTATGASSRTRRSVSASVAGALAAMGVVLVVITTLVVAAGMRIAGRDFMLRRP
jgi:hypothetical protein